jgi:hypothetical protein
MIGGYVLMFFGIIMLRDAWRRTTPNLGIKIGNLKLKT